MYVFNRWGTLLFESKDINIGWDDKDYDNKQCMQGIYLWVIYYKNPDSEGEVRIKKQKILTLIK